MVLGVYKTQSGANDIIMQIYLTIESLILCCCAYIINLKIYGQKFNQRILLLPFVYIPIIYISLVIDYNCYLLIYPFIVLLNIILLKFTCREIKITSLIYVHLFLFFTVAICCSIILVLIGFNRYILELISYIALLIVCLFSCFTALSDKIKLVISWTPKSLKITLLCIIAIIYWIGTLIVGIHEHTSNKTWLLLIQFFTLLMIFIVGLSFPVVISHSIKSQYLKRLTENYEKQIQIQAKHYSAIAKNSWELRRFQHDSKNLKVGLSELLERGDSQEALKMLNDYYEMSRGSKEAILKFDTGNGIVDALLADKQQIAQSINTTINFDGAVPANGITPTDLCVLFGNTLDNAIDACKKFPIDEVKNINIICKRISSYLIVHISNPVVENVVIHRNTIPTTKEDKSAHGFGLYSLEQVVRKHDGELKLTCNDHLFETAIDLCLDI